MNHSNSKIHRTKRESFIKRKVLILVSILIVALFVLSLASYVQTSVLNAVRGYVRGEGLYAKAQKDAVGHLLAYAQSENSQQYQSFLNALKVNLGDNQARVALQKDDPDSDRAFQGFLQGGNDPEDINDLITFFIHFQNFPYMKEAIVIWEEADVLIQELLVLGEKLKQAIENKDQSAIYSHVEALHDLNTLLHEKEYQFSAILSEGARWIKKVTIIAGSCMLLTIILLVAWITRRTLLSIVETEEELIVSENRFESLYRTELLGIIDWDKDGAITDANNVFLNMLGFSEESIASGQVNWRNITPEQYQQLDNEKLREVLEYGHCKPFEKVFVSASGEAIPVLVGPALLGGETNKGIAFTLDLSESKKAQNEIRLAATVFNSANNGILIADSNLNVASVNNTYLELTGYTERELLGKAPPFFANAHADGLNIKVELAMKNTWQGELTAYTKSGFEIPVVITINGVRDDAGAVTNYVIVLTDISERVAAEAQLRLLAHYDYLTGLANRSLFVDRFNQALSRAKRYDTMLGLLFIDLDKFKPVNDELGHNVGDQLLKTIATRICQQIRECDTVARYGGDEFIVLLEDMEDGDSAEGVAGKIMTAINETVFVNDHQLSVGCSIGVAIYPQDAQRTDELLKLADAAMYDAKQAGTNLIRRAINANG